MKKLFKSLPILLVALVGSMMFWSCGDDNDEPFNAENLPASAKTFLATYFPNANVTSATSDKDDYEVMLSNGTKVEFNKAGEWTDVDAAIGQTVPTGFYPAAIDTYVEANYPQSGINEISKETKGYDVELLNGLDILFDGTGSFIAIDF